MRKTKQGETWDMISTEVYGTPHKTALLTAANPDFSDVLIFDEGIELVIPETEETAPDSLPPWRHKVGDLPKS